MSEEIKDSCPTCANHKCKCRTCQGENTVFKTKCNCTWANDEGKDEKERFCYELFNEKG